MTRTAPSWAEATLLAAVAYPTRWAGALRALMSRRPPAPAVSLAAAEPPSPTPEPTRPPALSLGTDALTGLANRSTFLAMVKSALDSGDPDRTCSIILADLDGLKDINDSFGHLIGDEALRTIARQLAARAQSGDVVARFGGDEFAVLVLHTRGASVEEIAAPYAAVLDGTLYHEPASGRTVLLSACWGLATHGADGKDVTALFTCADEDLIQRKSTVGRAAAGASLTSTIFVPRGRRVLAEALGSLFDQVREVAVADDSEEFMRSAARRAAELLGTCWATVSLFDSEIDGGFRAVRTERGWETVRGERPNGPSILGHVKATGQPYFSNDLRNDPLANQELVTRLGLENCLAVPCRGTDGRLRGTLFLANKLGRAPFNDQDARLALAFADLCTMALEKTEALRAAREHGLVSDALLRAVAGAHTGSDPDALIRRVLAEAAALTGADTYTLAIMDDDGLLRLRPLDTAGREMEQRDSTPRLRLGEGVIGHVAQTGESYLSNDLSADPLTLTALDDRYGVRTQVAAPVRDRDGAVIAVISLFHRTPKATFSARDRRVLEVFADHLAVALAPAWDMAAE